MLVLISSDCKKKAAKRTQQVLDNYLPRIGRRSWSGQISNGGVKLLRDELIAARSKNTSVTCFVIRRKTELSILFSLGNQYRLSHETGRYAIHVDKRGWRHTTDTDTFVNRPLIESVANLSGLFHDLGKSNHYFQKKLRDALASAPVTKADPVRHEWLSAEILKRLLLQTKQNPKALTSRTTLKAELESVMRGDFTTEAQSTELKPTGDAVWDCVIWAVISHHRLPDVHNYKNVYNCFKPSRHVNENFSGVNPKVDASISESNKLLTKMAEAFEQILALKDGVTFSHGSYELVRLALILADHSVSAGNKTRGANSSDLLANLTGFNGEAVAPKQTLTDHLLRVGKRSSSLIQELESAKYLFPSISHDELPIDINNTVPDRFKWQSDSTRSIRETEYTEGFFAIICAETGAGKTRAIAKIVTAANDGHPLRYTTANGLRSLTSQSGAAYKNEIGYSDAQVVTLVGGQQSQSLPSTTKASPRALGSDYGVLDVEEAIIGNAPEMGKLPKGIEELLSKNAKATKLLASPIVVCTVDYLIQVAANHRNQYTLPAMRILTSDLVLDEIDDYGETDLLHICRLAWWVGLAGNKLFLSSATLPETLANGLFESYTNGLKERAKLKGRPVELRAGICGNQENCILTIDASKEKNVNSLWSQTIRKLKPPVPRKRCTALPVATSQDDWLNQASNAIDELHSSHGHQTIIQGSERNVSAILLRLGNIVDVAAMARHLASKPDEEGVQTIVCCYHSMHLLPVRAAIESVLDEALNRKKRSPGEFLQHPALNAMVKPEAKHIRFVVVATPVAEVGRDHDYDGLILELSSTKSLVQCAGRLWRHRPDYCPSETGIVVLSKSPRILERNQAWYSRPGPEDKLLDRYFGLPSDKRTEMVVPNLVQNVNSLARLQETKNDPLLKLEIERLEYALLHAGEQSVKAWEAGNFLSFKPRMPHWRAGEKIVTLTYENHTFYSEEGVIVDLVNEDSQIFDTGRALTFEVSEKSLDPPLVSLIEKRLTNHKYHHNHFLGIYTQ